MRPHHHDNRDDNEMFVFSHPVEMFLSVCAPIAATKKEVEDFANASAQSGAPFEAVNKLAFGNELGIDMGAETPNPCNWEPKARLHWFLVSVRLL